MKTIKVFLASSEELEMERLQFDSLFNHLNRIFRPRGIYLELSKWEYLDSSMGPKHKQDEYNEELKTCEMCMVLYWTKFGEYTHQELMTAYNELKEGRNPRKLYIFFKETGEITPELQSFKESFATEFGHFYCKFENVDTMRLQFLLQLEAYQNTQMQGVLKVEDSKVKVDGQAVVELDKVPFAAKNRRFQELKADIERIELEIKTFEGILAAGPNQAIQDLLGKKRSELFCKKEELSDHENFLFSTALRIAQQQGEKISGRMSRAIQAFEEGRAGDANAILEEAMHDAKELRQEISRTKELLKLHQENAAISISELLLKTSVVLADDNLSVEKRIDAAYETFKEAYALANESDYDQCRYMDFLEKYAKFLSQYAKYRQGAEIEQELLNMRLSMLGQDHPDVAKSYNSIALVQYQLGAYSTALQYLEKALDIRLSLYGDNHPAVASTYNNLGGLNESLEDFPKASEYYEKALNIRLSVYGEHHPDVAVSYNNLGYLNAFLGVYPKALEYHEKALNLWLSFYGETHPDVATSYNNKGLVYSHLGAYSQSLDSHMKALDIRLSVYGETHPDVAMSYNNMGYAHHHLGAYSQALECHEKALSIRLSVYGEAHPDVAMSYSNIGSAYSSLGEYSKALEYHKKTLDISLSMYGEKHYYVAVSYNNIADLYANMGEYSQALEYHKKAMNAFLSLFGGNHPNVAVSYKNIGSVYSSLGEYSQALEYYLKALNIRLSVYGETHPYVVSLQEKIAELKQFQ
jgi:tetratricopeptide (TPR) repeat protein